MSHQRFRRFDPNSGPHRAPPRGGGADTAAAQSLLEEFFYSVEGANYSQLHALKERAYPFGASAGVTVTFHHIQPDPFAPGSQLCVRVPLADYLDRDETLARYDLREVLGAHCDAPDRAAALFLLRGQCQVAMEDFLLRSLCARLHSRHRSGAIQLLRPSQHILPRSTVTLSEDAICIYLRVKLPGHGRRIDGNGCLRILLGELEPAVQQGICEVDQQALLVHVTSALDQEWLRQQLLPCGLVAFVCDGAVLPRAAGNSDLPMDGAVPFASPPNLLRSFTLPFSGRTIHGMGLPRGLTLIAGGGFHGKSTLLRALELGVYNHVPQDGRTFVVVDPTAVKIRAEDRRSIQGVDISSFINNLPLKKDTTTFATEDASGSTSQAANIVEALELGCTALLLDEDTSATNFMYRDALMAQLVDCADEPITPFVKHVRGLFGRYGVSTILVVGGSGQYFAQADVVLVLNTYAVSDVTEKAKEIALRAAQVTGARGNENANGDSQSLVKLPLSRCMNYNNTFSFVQHSRGAAERIKISATGLDTVRVAEELVRLDLVEQLVEEGQLNAIAQCFALVYDGGAAAAENAQRKWLLPQAATNGCSGGAAINPPSLVLIQPQPSHRGDTSAPLPLWGHSSFSRMMYNCEQYLRHAQLECQSQSCYLARGFTTLPRVFEIAAAWNRLRTLCITK